MTAEQLYLVLSEDGEVEGELEEVLLETDWVGDLDGQGEQVTALLKEHKTE
jgi:hypothetical protein